MSRKTSDAPHSVVAAVSSSAARGITKQGQPYIELLAGLGVNGDVHLGETVRHRSRMARDPTQRNLRQVHLIHDELHDELRAVGFDVAAGEMGENVTTRGVDLLALPAGARLRLGDQAVVELTGLRNPCSQLEGIQLGLMNATLDRDAQGNRVRKRASWRSSLPAARSTPATRSTLSLRHRRTARWNPSNPLRSARRPYSP